MDDAYKVQQCAAYGIASSVDRSHDPSRSCDPTRSCDHPSKSCDPDCAPSQEGNEASEESCDPLKIEECPAILWMPCIWENNNC